MVIFVNRKRLDSTEQAKLQAEVTQLHALQGDVDRQLDKALADTKAAKTKLLKAYQVLPSFPPSKYLL